ncbi:hypothetical protein AG1IA_09345 [Rhizoctonia solani AG-1 IA]|uniref:Uncharacterized protein n=1 Tax=Thanatephorus cucumeris (strain AG1-IA) TaxID=983506 RepID=L8WIJ4_THACA|nr:hypothetical protein AG1IA_09345 [Rhizoctonia solani AG-1 IA]
MYSQVMRKLWDLCRIPSDRKCCREIHMYRQMSQAKSLKMDHEKFAKRFAFFIQLLTIHAFVTYRVGGVS